MRRILLFFIFLSSITISSQELNCQVTVNFDQDSGSNRQVFTTLETAISEFVNQKNLVLQMDIEGNEYEVLEEITTDNLLRFSLILIEFHFQRPLHTILY